MALLVELEGPGGDARLAVTVHRAGRSGRQHVIYIAGDPKPPARGPRRAR